MHKAQANDEIGLIAQHQLGQLGVVFFPRGLDAGGGRRLLFLVLDEVVVVRGDGGAGGALQAEGVFAVGDDADDLGGECAVGGFVDHGLEIGAGAGY